MIERPQTEAEKDMKPGIDGNTTGFIKLGTKKDARSTFRRKVLEEEQEATKKGKPFARHAAWAEFEDHFNLQKIKLTRQYGYVPADKVKPLEIEWAKFSDLKNFKVIKEKERLDEDLTKRYLTQVFLKTVKYKYNKFNQTYTVMEDSVAAINRAKKLVK